MQNLDKDLRPAPALARDTMYENSFKSMYPAVNATALRPSGLRYRTQSQLSDSRFAEEFLINSRIRRFDREFAISLQGFYFDAPAVMSLRVGEEPIRKEDEVVLPDSVELRRELGEATGRRRSQRIYSGEALRFDDLTTVVRCAGAVTAHAEVEHPRGGYSSVHFRTTPSGGALYPIEVQVAALNVKQLTRGLYRYDPLRDRLLRLGDQATVSHLLETFCVDDETITLRRAGAIVLLVARPWRAMRKYGVRGLRHVFLEAGHIAQNIHLACVALGLGSVDCSSIYDDEAHEILQIDGLYEALVHTIIVGHPEMSG